MWPSPPVTFTQTPGTRSGSPTGATADAAQFLRVHDVDRRRRLGAALLLARRRDDDVASGSAWIDFAWITPDRRRTLHLERG
jgi:hypothetical protein